jgi:hypothetical protein
MNKFKSISVKETRKLKPGTWIRVWTGEDIKNIDRLLDGITVENDDPNKQVSFLSIEDKDVYVVDYDQVVEIGYDITSEDSGLEEIEEEEIEEDEDDENEEENEEEDED